MQAVKKSLTQDLHAGKDEEEYNTYKILTQTVCTIGPKTNNVEKLIELIENGMSVARLNFSHGDFDYHKSVIDNVRKAADATGQIIAIMLDTKGPEIRTIKLEGGNDVMLEVGQEFTFLADTSVIGNKERVATTYANLPKVVSPGGQILVDDGLISFTVIEVTADSVRCTVDNSGLLGENKGVNLPGTVVDLPAVTEKDKRDIAFGVENNVDMIAASFIRKAADVAEIRALPGVAENNIHIISKIESQEGLDKFNEVLALSDGIMVARGDLGVEIPIEKVILAQKMMIGKCNRAGKPVITATQMLESMIVNPRPTRAEATDVGNAVFDGTDCVMLSGETAKGAYPVKAVSIMKRISGHTEKNVDYRFLYRQLRAEARPPVGISDSIASSAVKSSWDVSASAIICLTDTGNTARLVSRYRPACPIIAVTPSLQVARQLRIARGCVPFPVASMKGTQDVINSAVEYAKRVRIVNDGDVVVITSGTIEGQSGSTNIMQVIRV